MNQQMELEELMALYSLDALDSDERAEAERLAHNDPALSTLVAENHEALAFVAEAVEHAPSTPSPRVWDGLVAAIEGRAAAEPVSPRRSRRRWSWGRTALAATMATAVVAVFAIAGISMLDSGDGDRLQVAVDRLLQEPASQVVTMTAPDVGSVEALVVIGDDGIGYIYEDTLPALGEDRTYQLWAIVDGDAGRQVISAGILGSDPGVSPFRVTGELAGLAITAEVAGGVITSEQSPTTVWLAET